MTPDDVERHIAHGDIVAARIALRRLICEPSGKLSDGSSLAELLGDLAQDRQAHPEIAAYVLRCLSVPGLIPDAGSTNQIARSIVRLSKTLSPTMLILQTCGPQTNFREIRRPTQRPCIHLAWLVAPNKRCPHDLEGLHPQNRL